MYHQTTVEEQVNDAERIRIRAEIKDLQQELKELCAKYPDDDSAPMSVIDREIEIGRKLSELSIEIEQCLWCEGRTLPGKAYCLGCSNDQIRIANQVLAEILAEESAKLFDVRFIHREKAYEVFQKEPYREVIMTTHEPTAKSYAEKLNDGRLVLDADGNLLPKSD